MTRDEFERCRRRFGDTVEAWPAPFRQQALALMAAERKNDPDAALDRLVLEAALIDGDDQELARNVLARIEAGSPGPSLLARLLLSPTGFVACAAAALVAATLAGYQVARLQDDPSDTELLALASGSSLADGGVVADYPAEEGSL
ncbi:hypothetical protein FJ942_28095 [Mesorhizobium sp. B2-4-2]|uniref:hypothetical protein n=1 Tax=unclassified Mesorhizobium TaxID=325217 RepID=UPI00112912FD|nr:MULTISPECIES: hypothetical protein [unclassified Mesorhizobium]MBZ9920436.1 hypothetical protein [Mesorhizobium sp. BR1-1-7]MBZ9956477.1 hypothetical protein [Mesorhizobium sp. BR1-1-15]MBZ9961892.1 hypothetical protein [Mesorhizobium sp. BR1-1-14]MBZ9973695.1 hypothetical protein [Mesorhizobium sp. BR1-1-12]TPL42348.1 hypothetical protein FJ937_28285 [Mesorhizobium sp. B2-4-4]